MCDSPNVLCVSLDSLRRDHAPFVTGEETTPPLTPFLDEFATDATTYPSAVSPSTWTTQVHPSVFTGLYPPEHGVLDRGYTLGDHPTFAELLADAGYETGFATRNDWVTFGDILRGFGDVDLQSRAGDDGPVERLRDAYENTPIPDVLAATFRGSPEDPAVVEEAIDRLTTTDEPFCYFLHLNDVHWPYTPRAPNHRRYTDRGPLALFWNRAYWQPRLYEGRHRCWAGLLDPPPEQVELLRALYRGCVYATDRLMARLFRALESAGVLDDTIVVAFGDHGDSFGEDGGIGHHFSVADEIIRVPLLVRDPTGRLPAGSDDRLVNLSDIYPTVLELCGVDPPETTSYSLLGDERRETAFCYYTLPEESHLEDQLATVPAERLPPRRQYCAWRSPEEKLVWYPDREEYAGPAAEDEALRGALHDHLDRQTRVPTGSQDVSDEALSRLDSMGYV